MSALLKQYTTHAVGSFLGAGGGGTWDRQRGYSNTAPTRNGAGDYSIVLDPARSIDPTPAQHILLGTPASGASAMLDAVIVDATHIRCRSFSGANAAADMRFSIIILDLGVA